MFDISQSRFRPREFARQVLEAYQSKVLARILIGKSAVEAYSTMIAWSSSRLVCLIDLHSL
jgi:hypothetical protein